jgi:hypothetical protein
VRRDVAKAKQGVARAKAKVARKKAAKKARRDR